MIQSQNLKNKNCWKKKKKKKKPERVGDDFGSINRGRMRKRNSKCEANKKILKQKKSVTNKESVKRGFGRNKKNRERKLYKGRFFFILNRGEMVKKKTLSRRKR